MILLRSLSFRLAVLYSLLFTVSVGLLGGVYYWAAIRGPLESVEAGLVDEAAALRLAHQRDGIEALATVLERRAAAPAPRLAYHALVARNGSTITANLPSWPTARGDRWLRIEADVSREGREDEYEALVLDERLPDGSRLLLGRDIEDLEELEEGIANTAAWLLPLIVLLSIVGGAVMSRAIGRRIESVSKAALQVIEGDLTRRVPVTGANDDFDHLARTLNTMLERIQGAFESIQRVSDTVAHELRTPLSRLHAELAELSSSDDPEGLARAIVEAERLRAMFDSVLRISRVEAGSYSTPKTPVDLTKLVDAAVELFEPSAADRKITLMVDVAPGLIVTGDPDLLFQGVGNLLDNAIKFAPDGGVVRVCAQPRDAAIVLEIADNGPGIAPEYRDRVTERFFRLPSSFAKPGFGLGLSLVAAIARHHCSRLELADASPGLIVRWRLPDGR